MNKSERKIKNSEKSLTKDQKIFEKLKNLSENYVNTKNSKIRNIPQMKT